MARPKVATRVTELRTPVVQEAQLSMAQRLKQLENAVLLNPKDCFDENGQPLSIRSMPDHVARAISGYEVDPEKFVTKVKFIDKRAAIMDYTKLVGDLPTKDERPAEHHDVPGLVSMEQFSKLTLPEKLAMRQKLLAVLQEFSGPRVING